MILFLIMMLLGSVAARAQENPPPPGDTPIQAEGNETRYSLALINETSFYSGLRVLLPEISNVTLIEPSFSYRHNRRWRFTTNLAGELSNGRETDSRLLVRETYAGVSAGDFDFTAGKRIVRWGAGYGFTPTGVLDPPRIPTDPQDHLGLNQGLEMVTADWVQGKNALTAAWATSDLFHGQNALKRDTFALRYNVLIRGFDIAVIAAHDRNRQNGRDLWGANFTRVIGEAIEIHGEFARRTTPAMLVGVKYTERSGWSAIAEYYTPGGADWTTPGQIAAPGTDLTQGAAPVGGPRRHYYFARVAKSRLRELPGWKEWDVAAYVVGSFRDGSHVVIAEVDRKIGTHFSCYVRAQLPGGSRSSEFGVIPYRAVTSLGLRFQL